MELEDAVLEARTAGGELEAVRDEDEYAVRSGYGEFVPEGGHRGGVYVEFRLIDYEDRIFARNEGLSDEIEHRTLAVAHLRCGIGIAAVGLLDIDVVAVDYERAMGQQSAPDRRQLFEFGLRRGEAFAATKAPVALESGVSLFGEQGLEQMVEVGE